VQQVLGESRRRQQVLGESRRRLKVKKIILMHKWRAHHVAQRAPRVHMASGMQKGRTRHVVQRGHALSK
jgi:hypothetical protein